MHMFNVDCTVILSIVTNIMKQEKFMKENRKAKKKRNSARKKDDEISEKQH